MEVTVNYEPFPKQQLFHMCPADETVYGGSKGGGKTKSLVAECAAYVMEHPGASAYLFRETYDDLESNIIKEWKAMVPMELYKYSETKKVAVMYNGSTVHFRYIKSKQDAEGYDGRSIDFIGVDELTKHPEDSIQILLSCLRSPKGFPPRFRGSCNPGGIGHSWVRNRYIRATNNGAEIAEDPVSGNKIAFIPAKVYDNLVIMEKDPAYIKRLENLPPKKRAAYLHGDWDTYDGQAFEEFNANIHVVEPFPIPNHWKRWRSVDNGYSAPFAWYWFTVDEAGHIFIYREYTRERCDPKLNWSQQAKIVVARSMNMQGEEGKSEYTPEIIGPTFAGHDAFSRHPEAGKTIADYYRQGGVMGIIKGPTDRAVRKAVWHEYLAPGADGLPRVQIFRTCRKLVETLPVMVEDEKDPEKVADNDLDHWYEGCLTGDTIINTVDGNIPIADLVGRSGELHCFDLVAGKQTIGKYHDVRKTRANADVYEIETEDGRKIRATGDHQILTKDGWKAVLSLTEADDVIDISPHGGAKVKKIGYLGKEDTYNLEVDGHQNFSVNGGLIVHNSSYGLVGWHTNKTAILSAPPPEQPWPLRTEEDHEPDDDNYIAM